MNARRLGVLVAVITLLASGGYFFVYLYRWEWNRAQVSAAIFIAAEIGIVAWLLTDRIRRVERRLTVPSPGSSERMIGCEVAWACAVACRLGESSQQAT